MLSNNATEAQPVHERTRLTTPSEDHTNGMAVTGHGMMLRRSWFYMYIQQSMKRKGT